MKADPKSTSDVWIVDDDSSIRWRLQKGCQQANISARAFADGNYIPRLLNRVQPKVIVTDIRMPGLSGLELLEEIQKRAAHIPVVVMTAHTGLDSAVASYRGGAFEYMPKPFATESAIKLIQRALAYGQEQAPTPPSDVAAQSEMLGEAPAMQDVFRAIGRLSNSDINVLIRGESGTGKELVARALHHHSPRASQPFIAINTAAIPSELLESELFGHEKGAFTGAHSRRQGRFEQADGGTLFLDEIGDMPAALQTRLLRVLSDNRFYRVGGHEELEVDVRVLAATHQDLQNRVAQGKFREDLYHRLNVINILLPPVRERTEDIPLLVEHFLQRTAENLNVDVKKLTRAAMDKLCAFPWPGNVRQIENMCRWMTAMAAGQTVDLGDLPPELQSQDGAPAVKEQIWENELRKVIERRLQLGEQEVLKNLGPRFERILLQAALKHTNGHKQEAAKRLGWGRNTLTRKLRELGL